MVPFLSTGAVIGAVGILAAVTTDGFIVSGLVVYLVGLIAWSKYREPPLSDPYAATSTAPGTGARPVEAMPPLVPPVDVG